MNYKRFLILILVFTVIGTASALADDAYEYYKGKEVSVVFNDEPIEEKGLIINSKTMLPLSNVARTLQALVKWDSATETAYIYKPNVHITLFGMNKDKISGPFGKVEYKGKYDFVIFTQVDSLLTDISSIRVTMEDPYGKEVYSKDKELTKDDQKDNGFWFGTPTITHLFKYTGKYTIKFYMKSGDDPYSLVSEKVVQSSTQE